MKTLKEAGMSIGDFAANLMSEGAVKPESISKTPVQELGVPDDSAPDISNIEVPDAFISEVTTVGSIGVNMAGPAQKRTDANKKAAKEKKKLPKLKPGQYESTGHSSKEDSMDLLNYLRGYRCAGAPGSESPKEAGTDYYKKLSNPNRKITTVEAAEDPPQTDRDLMKQHRSGTTVHNRAKNRIKFGKRQARADAWKKKQAEKGTALESLMSKIENAIMERVDPTTVSTSISKKSASFEKSLKKVKSRYGIK
jgi:hypothetical protein